MGIKLYRPTTPSRRKTSVDDFADITTKKPYKPLLVINKSKAGRNVSGKITVRHRGGGEKRFYRIVDFKQFEFDIPAKVETIEYDPNRSARIALICYSNGKKSYILAPDKLKVGDVIVSSQEKVDVKIGNRLPLKYIPVGEMVYNIEREPGRGGEFARSAGMTVQIMATEGKYTQVKMPSGEIRMISKDCMASVGQVSNIEHFHVRVGRAGRKRHMGWRPTVRGKAMNPIDHPHGGGEGRNPIGLKHPKTPWGKPALGVKSRKKGKFSDKLILKRRKKNK